MISQEPPEEPREAPPHIGDARRFVPAANYQATDGFAAVLSGEIAGIVVQIHEAHRWYRVRYELPGGCTRHECFKY